MQVKNIAKSMVVGVATLASASALAWDFDGVYVLGGVTYAGVDQAGFSDHDGDDQADFGNPEDFSSRGDIGWRAGVGAWLTDSFAVEFNYFGIANMSDSQHEGAAREEINTQDMVFFDLSGVGRCYFADNFWGFARLGVAYANVEREFEVAGVTEGRQKDGSMGAAIGIGAQYDFNPMFGLRLEANTIQALDNNDMYAIGANVVINFDELMM